MLMTRAEALEALTANFPGVEFVVKRGAYSRGTNFTKEVLEVSYNHKRNPLSYLEVAAVVPGASVWARGKRAS